MLGTAAQPSALPYPCRKINQMRLLERLEDDERLDGLLETLQRRAPDASADGFDDGFCDRTRAHASDLWCAAVCTLTGVQLHAILEVRALKCSSV